MDELGASGSWTRLVASQHGMVSRAQAVEHGFTDERILAQLTARRWQRRGRGVFAITTGPLSHEAQLHAALLAIAEVAALSHETAAREWGMLPLTAPPPTRWHVTVPVIASARGHPDLHVHRSRAFEHIVTERNGLPITTPAHTVLDLALAAPDGPAALATVLRMATAGGVKPASLRDALGRRNLRRYRRAILEAIRLLEEGVTSALETRWVLDVERAHGLPEADRQVPVDVDGHTLFEDCIYRCPRGEAIVRLDGATHARRRIRLRDRRRGNAAELAGRSRLVYGWEEIVGEPCATARELEVVLRSIGWTGEFIPCGRCRARVHFSGS